MENRVQKVYKHLGWLMSLKVRVMNVWVNVFVEWNRRVEPEGPNELEKANSQSKETKIAELLKRLDSRRELPVIEEEQEEDVDADTESAVDEATPAAITETNNDNDNVVAERQLVAAVATSSERKLVAAVATSSESHSNRHSS